MSIGILYTETRNIALDAFKGFVMVDFMILQCLDRNKLPLNFQVLLHNVCAINNMYNAISFVAALKRLVAGGYVTRKAIGKNVSYSITMEGKRLLLEFDRTWEQLVKERIMKFGNGVL